MKVYVRFWADPIEVSEDEAKVLEREGLLREAPKPEPVKPKDKDA